MRNHPRHIATSDAEKAAGLDVRRRLSTLRRAAPALGADLLHSAGSAHRAMRIAVLVWNDDFDDLPHWHCTFSESSETAIHPIHPSVKEELLALADAFGERFGGGPDVVLLDDFARVAGDDPAIVLAAPSGIQLSDPFKTPQAPVPEDFPKAFLDAVDDGFGAFVRALDSASAHDRVAAARLAASLPSLRDASSEIPELLLRCDPYVVRNRWTKFRGVSLPEHDIIKIS